MKGKGDGCEAIFEVYGQQWESFQGLRQGPGNSKNQTSLSVRGAGELRRKASVRSG